MFANTTTVLSIPERCITNSSINSESCLIKERLPLPISVRLKDSKSTMRKNQKLWKVYIPSIAIILFIFVIVGSYGYHALMKAKPQVVHDSQSVAETTQTGLLRRFDSRDGQYKRGSPMNSLEVGVYYQCDNRFDELSAHEFVNTQCQLCSRDYGIVSTRVRNLCIVGPMLKE